MQLCTTATESHCSCRSIWYLFALMDFSTQIVFSRRRPLKQINSKLNRSQDFLYLQTIAFVIFLTFGKHISQEQHKYTVKLAKSFVFEGKLRESRTSSRGRTTNHLGVPSQNDKELGSRLFCGVPVDSLLVLLHLKTVLDAVYLKAKFFCFYALLIFHKLCMISLQNRYFQIFMVGLPVENSSHFGSEIWHVPILVLLVCCLGHLQRPFGDNRSSVAISLRSALKITQIPWTINISRGSQSEWARVLTFIRLCTCDCRKFSSSSSI